MADEDRAVASSRITGLEQPLSTIGKVLHTLNRISSSKTHQCPWSARARVIRSWCQEESRACRGFCFRISYYARNSWWDTKENTLRSCPRAPQTSVAGRNARQGAQLLAPS